MKNETVNESLKKAIYRQVRSFVGAETDQTVIICVPGPKVDIEGAIIVECVVQETKYGSEFVSYNANVKELMIYDSLTDEEVREYTFEEKIEIEKYLNDKINQ